MGGTEASKEPISSQSSMTGAHVVRKLPHPVFGNILVCDATFKNGSQSVVFKKEVLIDSSELAKKLLDYSKTQELEPLYNDLFLTVHGYQLDKQAVVSSHTGHVRQQRHRQHLLRALRLAARTGLGPAEGREARAAVRRRNP